MKTVVFTVILLLIHLPEICGQQLPNCGFEDWNYHFYYRVPQFYQSSNFWGYIYSDSNTVNYTNDSHYGMYALKLQTTLINEEEIIPGVIYIGKPTEDGYISPGFGFTSHPDSVVGFVKHNLQIEDSAKLIVIFYSAGNPIGMALKTFGGIQNNYYRFSLPVNWVLPAVNPDSIGILISSSDLESPIPGSTIIFDDISFINSTQAFPNGGFELWNNYGSEEPIEWNNLNLYASYLNDTNAIKTNDSYSGAYALKIKTISLFNEDTQGIVTLGKYSDDGPYGGIPTQKIPDKITGYYKYYPQGNDTALASIYISRFEVASNSSIILDSKIIKLIPASNYTFFEIPLSYNSYPLPDTMNVTFSSSNTFFGGYANLGSYLLIDDLLISYKPLSVAKNDFSEGISLFYNSSTNQITLNLNLVTTHNIDIQLIDVTGNIIYQANAIKPSGAVVIATNNLKSGIYFCRFLNDNNVQMKKIMVY